MRRLRSALLLPILGLAVAAPGCGGDGAVEEVPGPPPTLSVPHQKGAADVSGSSADATPTPTATPGAEATAAPGTTGSTGATGGTGTTSASTGAAATPAPATQDTQTTDQAPAAGSPPQKFEQFCQENVGAC